MNARNRRQGEWTVRALGILAAALVAASAGAATWDGGGDGANWFDGSNWNPDGVPGGGATVAIGTGAAGMRSVAFGKNDPLIATHRDADEYRLPIPAIYFEGPAYAEAYEGVSLLIDVVSGKNKALGQKLEVAAKVYVL